MEGKGSPASGKPEAVSHLQAQLDQMTGRNQELRQELRLAREEASEALSGLAKAQVKVLVCLSVRERIPCFIYLIPLLSSTL